MARTNWALPANGASATATSTYNPGGDPYNVANLIDGNDGSAWVSNVNNLTGGTTFAKIDLGQARVVGAFRVYNQAYTNGYVLESSTDNTNWTNRYTGTGPGDTGIVSQSPVTARWWRIRFTSGLSGNQTHTVELLADYGFTVDAVIAGERTSSKTLNAVVRTTQTGSFNADAVRFKHFDTQPYPSAILPDTPAFWVRFEEQTGAFLDSSGNNRTITITGTPTRGIASPLAEGGFAAAFDSGSSLAVGYIPTSLVASSVETWFKTTTTGFARFNRSRNNNGGGSSGRGLQFGIGNGGFGSASGKLNAYINSDNVWLGVHTNATYNDGNWHHAVATWSRASGQTITSSDFKIYVDGVSVATTIDSRFDSITSPLTGLGMFLVDGNVPLTADEVAFYQTALSAQRVAAHYLAGIGGVGLLTGIPLNATKLKAATGTFTANAVVRTSSTGSFSLDAWFDLAFSLNAWLVVSPAGGFYLNAVVRQPSLTADAVLSATLSSSFALGAVLVAAGWVPDPIRITVGGVDVTRHVIWHTASFTAKVNGAVGECAFTVRDDNHVYDFTFGDEIVLTIHGVPRWGGWLLRPQRTFWFSVEPHPLTQPRRWQLEGVDYNAIFDKRILHDLAHPDKAWNYAPGTYDDTIINDIWGYFDMAGFGREIHRVAVAILDIPGVTAKGRMGGLVASGGYTLREVLSSITRNTAAIFFCSPTKTITYLDSDTATVIQTLTDVPSAAHDVGYREVRLTDDSTQMCNDALAWGAGYGGPNMVFSRQQDASSIATYGRWQKGRLTPGVYKQATINALADSYVEGSPAARRAQKYPKRGVELVTDAPYFGAGDVVDVVNTVFDYTDTLPIRVMVVTFPTPSVPRFRLSMSWEIDMDWGMIDPWVPKVDDVAVPGGDDTTKGTTPPTSECDCPPTDTFEDRTLPLDTDGPGFGRASSGLRWTGWPEYDINDYTGFTVVDGMGVWDGTSDGYAQQLALPFDTTFDGLFWFESMGASPTNYIEVILDGSESNYAYIYLNYLDEAYSVHVRRAGTGETGTPDSAPGVFSGKTWCRISVDATSTRIKVWPFAGSEPDEWTAESIKSSPEVYPPDPTIGRVFAWLTSAVSDELHISHLDISGVDNCSLGKFDDFTNRDLDSDMGISSLGYGWIASVAGGQFAVTGGHLTMPYFAYPMAWHVLSDGAILGTPDWAAFTHFGYAWGVTNNVVAYINAPGYGTFVTEVYGSGSVTDGSPPDWASIVGLYDQSDYLNDGDYYWYNAIPGWDTPIVIGGQDSRVTITSTQTGGGGLNATYTVVVNVTSGTFDLRYVVPDDDDDYTVTGMPFDISAAAMQQALATGSYPGAPDPDWFTVTGTGSVADPFIVTFIGSYANMPGFLTGVGDGDPNEITPIGPGQTVFNPYTGHVYSWYPGYADYAEGTGALDYYEYLYDWPTDGDYVHTENGYFWDMGVPSSLGQLWLPTMDMTSLITVNEINDYPGREFAFQVSQDEYLWLVLTAGDTPADKTIRLMTNNGGVELDSVPFSEFTFEAGFQYMVRWQFAPGDYSRAKVWKATESEPSEWMVSGVPTSNISSGEFGIELAGETDDAAHDVEWIDFDYEGKPCYYEQDGNPITVPAGIAERGWVSETIEATGGQTVQLARAFSPGSVTIWADGLRQAPAAFTPYPLEGALVFDTAIAAGATIVVKYFANGTII